MTLIGLLIAVAAADSFAQSKLAPGLDADITVGFGGRFRHAAWTPVAVDIRHARGLIGTLEVAIPRTDLFSAAQSYVRLTQPISLEPGESGRFWFTVPLRSSPYPLTVTIKDRGNRIIGELVRELRGGAVGGPLFLVLDPAAVAWTFLSDDALPGAASTEVFVAQIRRASDLPSEPLALSSVSALFIRDTFPFDALSPDQVAAIAAYVRSGGHLIATGGSSPPAFPLTWLSWLPETTGRVSTYAIDLTAIPLWELFPNRGELSLDASNPLSPPLWSSTRVGAGRATIIAFDPSSPALVGVEGIALRTKAAQFVLDHTPNTHGPEISDDDMWGLINQIEIPFGNNQLLTVVAIVYALAVTSVAFLALHRPAFYAFLALLIGATSWYAWDLTRATGVRDQAGFAHVQLTRGFSPGVVLNRSFTLGVSMAHFPRDLEIVGPSPPVFPAAYRPDSDVHVAITPTGARFEQVLPAAPIRVYHDSFEEIDIRVYARADENKPLTIVNNSDYELRYVHYIERRRLANLGHIPPRTTKSWTEPSARVASAGWMGMTLQTGLLRLNPGERPDDVEVRLLALAADRGLGESLIQAEADRPFVVALMDPNPVVEHHPAGQSIRKRVLILPVFDADPYESGGVRLGI